MESRSHQDRKTMPLLINCDTEMSGLKEIVEELGVNSSFERLARGWLEAGAKV